jgi:hypothetical protein
MHNDDTSVPVLREFITRITFNLSALIAMVAGAVNLPDLFMLLMPL